MMTLKDVRDFLRVFAGRPEGTYIDPSVFSIWADAIDFHLSNPPEIPDSSAQPQPVARGEAVALDIEWPEFHHRGMGCGLEDRGITDRYEAMRYGWDEALHACAQAVDNATPTIPTGHRVVPVEPEDLSNCTDGFGINKPVNAMLADALRHLAKPGQKVIWRGSFRWFDDNGVLSNHYDGMDIDHLARDFDYEVHYDAHHAALVSKKEAPDAGV